MNDVEQSTPGSTLVTLTGGRARHDPRLELYTFLADGESPAAVLSCAELDRRARGIAVRLAQRVAPGDRLLLLYQPGLEYLCAFLGCLYAGAVAVPAYPPRRNRSLPRLRAIVEDARPAAALTDATILRRVERWLDGDDALAGLPWIAEEGDGAGADDWVPPELTGDTLAFLQYTSGSTGRPKGVALSHANLLDNLGRIARSFALSPDDRGVIWLPPYHDMGLIGGILSPLYAGFPVDLMSPASFLQRPARWLEAISRRRATVSGGPDFAYRLCVERIAEEDRRRLDLSSWRVAFDGAEPVRAETLDRFAEAFTPAGFRRSAFYPCYGLAEATLLVTGGDPAAPPAVARVRSDELERGRVIAAGDEEPEGRRLVGSGAVRAEELLVVDPDSLEVAGPGAVGEIWVAGPSVARGYWERPEETRETFDARTADGRGPFLRTGDLGFLRDGELYVTGRIKDLIILRGRNLYPHDVEHTVEACHPGLRAGSGAAFSVDVDGEERLVVAHEVVRRPAPDPQEVAAAIRTAVAAEHEAAVHDVALLRTGTVPKTSSGKIRRRACRERYLAGGLEAVARIGRAAGEEAAGGPAAAGGEEGGARERLDAAALARLPPDEQRAVLVPALLEALARALGTAPEHLDPGQPVPLDSLAAIELQARLEAVTGASPPLAELLEGAGAEDLARWALSRLAEPRTGDPGTAAGGEPAGAVAPVEAADRLPLTRGQRALWLLHRLAPESPAYNLAFAARVRSSLDADALERTVGRLVGRHAALRTRFHDTPEGPFQEVLPPGTPGVAAFEVTEASGRPPAELLAAADAEAHRPFDLERGPLLRVRVWSRGPQDHLMLVGVHHVAVDLGSLVLLLEELGALYAAEVAGEPTALPPPGPSSADLAGPEAERLEGQRGEELWRRWRRVLEGAPAVLELPTDRPRPASQGFRGDSVPLRIRPASAAALAAAAEAVGATPFAALLAAWGVLLGRMAGTDELLVGVPSAGRRRPELATAVGYLVNPLPLRLDLAGEPSFRDLVERVGERLVEALEHQDLPFPEMVERLGVERDASRSPLFQVMLAFERPHRTAPAGIARFVLRRAGGRMDLGGLRLESVDLPERGAPFDLLLTAAAEEDGGLGAALRYDADLFDRTTALRIGRRLEALVAVAAAAPERPVAELPLLTRAEAHQVCVEWNAEGAPPAGRPLPGAVAAAARRRPDAVAVVGAAGVHLTYRGLLERADGVARRLRSLGVGPEAGPEVPVGVLAQRTPAAVAALLGVLRAGAPYLPLDPAYPPARLRMMLEDSGAPVVLADAASEALAAEAVEGLGARVEPLGHGGAPAAPAAAGGAVSDPDPSRLAYLIYTSGSTGRPKGVAIPHGSAAALVAWALREFSAEELSGVLAATSFCFDLSVFELFAPLAAGGSVLLARDALELPSLPAAPRVRLVNTVPSAMTELVRAAALPEGVRTVALAGEPLRGELVRAIGAARPTVGRVMNLYGPSEDTTYSTLATMSDPAAPGEPTIGRPLPGTRAHVVDARGRPAPVGVPGELLLGGPGLARGYLGRPAATAERFVPDPFGGRVGERLYRTGDLVRLRPDGELEFLGRLDHQVKIRGFRVELGEVEAVLLACPGVREAVAVARPGEGDPAERTLVAYAVAEDRDADPGALRRTMRERLAARLPAAMVPSAFMVLEELPLLPNGKVDRRALPEPPRRGGTAGGPAGGAPATDAERAVAAVWRRVLGVEAIGRDDDFFRLGGHSLLGARVASTLRRETGVELPLRAVFQNPRLADLARWVAGSIGERDGEGTGELTGASEPAAPAAPPGRPVPLSFAQERLWFMDRLVSGTPLYNMPLALALEGDLDPAALAETLGEVARRHRTLRTRFEEGPGGPVQVVEEGPLPGLPTVDLTALPEGPRARAAGDLRAAEARRPFDLGRPPMVRGLLLRLDGRRHHLLLTLHHISADGWSLGVLAAEMGALYRARRSGRPSPLPEIVFHYTDHALRQRRVLTGPPMEAAVDAWRRRLEGLRPLELPADRPRPPVRRYRGGRVPLVLPAELAERLEAASRGVGATRFMALLAGLDALLARITGSGDVPVGTPVAGRDLEETEGLIGFFVNTLVLRTEVTPELSFRELLTRVREVTLDAYAHQELPFEKLVERLAPSRDPSLTPFFQVVLALQTTPLERPELPALEVRELPSFSGTAKFDLTIDLRPEAGAFEGWIEYDADLFDASTVCRIGRSYATLLEAAATAPDRPLAELPLLGRGERHQVVREWSGPAHRPPVAGTVHGLVAARAAERPDAVAVVAEGETLSYGELLRRSGLRARRLRALGVRRGDLVGVSLERTPELVVTLLAVLRAGAAYLPLDPSYPAHRLRLMLEDPETPPVVVTTRAGAGRLPDVGGGLLLVDAVEPAAEWGADDGAELPLAPEDLAYVIYTSGSTGRPKGVAVPHGGVVRLVRGADHTRLAPDQAFLHMAPVAFDASTLEIWAPLTSGGRLVLHPPEPPSPASLARFLGRQRVTLLFLTTALFNQTAEEEPGAFDPVGHLMTGGEAASVTAMRRVLARSRSGPGRLLLSNVYGPTENTTFSTHHPMTGPEQVTEPVPIGRAIANSTCCVVDPALRPVPPGVPGELLTGGAGVARGYLGRPALTAEKFVPDPFAGRAGDGGRLYRTGDLVRWLPDGAIEFIGRIDHQVKLRGFRIEMGEVEAAAASHPGVAESVALVVEAPGRDRRLVLYAVPREGTAGDELAAALPGHLRDRLPEFMLPSACVPLPRLPLTPNGKVDRRALPEPDWGAAGGAGRAPRGPAEELVAEIWRDLLGLEEVGAEDSFFDLGGHSLLATRLASRVRDAFGVDVPLRRIFEAPTVAGVAALAAAEEGIPEAPPLEPLDRPRPADRPFEAEPSFAQQRLWFLDRLDPGSAVYNIAGGVRLRGAGLRLAALAASLRRVVERHESLRTGFREREGWPVQVIEPRAAPPVPLVDLCALPRARRRGALGEVARAEASRPFALHRAPLVRAVAVRAAADDHALLLTMHHSVSDGWSVGVLVRDLAAFYAAAVRDRPPELPELPVQYADYAAWQRGWLRGEALEARLRYWRGRLAGAPPALELPADRPRTSTGGRRAGSLPVALPPALSEGIGALARSRGATPFMVLLAALSAVLGRHGGRDDVVVGSPVAGRTRVETEDLIGFFVNTLALRVSLGREGGDGPSFAGLVDRVREVTLGAYAHQELPFERLVEELGLARELGKNPLFEVMLALQNTPVSTLELEGVAIGPLDVDPPRAMFELLLSLEETPEGVRGRASYDREVFDPTTIRRLLGHLEALLVAAVAAPETALAALPAMTRAQRHALLFEWGSSAAVSPPEGSFLPGIPQAVAARAAAAPEAVALRFRAGEGAGSRTGAWTYGELLARADRLARRLVARGVGPDVPVGVFLERSPALVAALLGVLRAGGAYVALDPAYPRERLLLLVEDALAGRSPVLVTEEALLPLLPPDLARRGIAPLVVDRPDDGAASAPLPAPPEPETLAYLIYTSGSTGRPKGVAIPHRAAAALLAWARTAFSPGELSSVFAGTSVSFDLSVFELFVPLAAGGSVVLGEDHLALGSFPGAAPRLVNTVPSAMAELVRLGRVPESVETVNLAGEALKRALVDAIRDAAGPVRVLNLYGPSEDTTYSTWAPAEIGERAEPTIGRPVSGTRASVLGPGLRPLPPGVPGELCLGGDGLARGYLGRPGRTAESFVPDPACGGGAPAGSRIYRTGDLVRFLPDGRLAFHGRIDHQVKVRGFRIEPGEIEAHLVRHPAVEEAAVVAVEAPAGGDLRLVAFVETAGDGRPEPEELRELLGQRLPAHMVPSAFAVLDALPLTPNGKVDRNALAGRAPAALQGVGGAGAAPRGPVEEIVAGLWRELLGVAAVSRDDGFFDLGGHSLLATRLVARLRSAFGVELPVRSVFETPTVAGMAAAVEEARVAEAAGGVEPAPPLVPRQGDGPAPLSHAQERLWFVQRLEPESPAYHMPAALRLRGRLHRGRLARALDAVVRRHGALRTRFEERGGEVLQVVAPKATVELPVVDLSGAGTGAGRRAAADRLAAAEVRRPFDLARGPLVRFRLFQLAPEEHLLVVVLHHIVSDGWSVAVLVREMGRAYERLSAGADAGLPEPPVQYADVAVWQRDWLRGEALERRVAYWRRALEGAPRHLDLPTDRPRPPVQSLRGASLHAALDGELADALRRFGRERGASLFMVLLAGFGALLGRLAGQEQLLVGSPIAGRTRREMEELVGCFLNTLVLHIDLAGAPGFGELVERVRETALGAYAHQELPFEKLLEELRPERDLSRSPLFQVFFNMINVPTEEIDLPGVTAEPVETAHVGSKFDLTLYLDEPAGPTDRGEIRLHLVYSTDLFDRERMAELLDQYRTLLAAAVARPERAVAELPLATGRARSALPDPAERLDDTWHGAVHELFAERAREAPERTAVVDAAVTWSYRELDRRSARLAAALAAAGVGRGDLVAIWGARSAALPWAVLGALRAGAAFTVLDPAYPPARVVRTLELAQPRAFLEVTAAGPAAVGALPGASLAPPPEVDAAVEAMGLALRLRLGVGRGEDPTAAAPGGTEAPVVEIGPDDLAYVAFTSGSTGDPKGVLGRHGPLSHFLPWQRWQFRLGPGDRYSMLSGLAHDPLQRDLFTALATGATLCVPEPRVIQASGRLAEWMADVRVTVAHLTPALGQVLTESAERRLPALRRAFFVGDALTGADVARLRSLAPGVEVVNLFGSTETQRAVGWFRPGKDPGRGVLPLGRGMPGVQLLVLAAGDAQAGIGEVGEVCVRSPHLAAGYLGDPELTRKRFVVNPFTGAAADRLYRTGDLGRYRTDGNVEFLGRGDVQVKIRGFRVEPGEVEAALRSLPEVRDAVVVPWGEGRDRRLAAYLVPETAGEELEVAAVRAALRRLLPEQMVPSFFTPMEALPLTPNRKVDRRALPEPVRPGVDAGVDPGRGGGAPAGRLEERVAAIWREVLEVDRVGVEENFFDLGGHSLLLVRLHARLREELGEEVSLMDLFGHPTVRAQAARLAALGAAAGAGEEPREEAAVPALRGAAEPAAGPVPVAVVGMAGRFPGAPDLETFWSNLRGGVDSISRFAEEDLLAAGVDPELVRHPRYVPARGVLDGADRFDAGLFDFTPRQAEITDPQHRLFLQACWQALEDAGCEPERVQRGGGRVGVFAGETLSTYFLHNLLSRPDLLHAFGGYQAAISTDRDYLTTLVSYKLGLRGPSLAVQTACSTSLVAVHLACRALAGGECSTALAGGVSIKVPQVAGYLHEDGGIDSPDGRCRPFDARAAGTVWGSGVGVVALKRLDDALADGDPVRAVIRGSAVNNDGSLKVGYTAPGIDGQAEVIGDALDRGGVDPATISYVEAHGTATQLGDPVEVAALSRALGRASADGPCRLGSVKSNVGHLGAAAGIVGLIKTVLALEHREIPPSLHFEQPNPAIDFAGGRFAVASELTPWEAGDGPRLAGVSSFGMGGTNAHVVLEEAPERPPPAPSPRRHQLLLLSARGREAAGRAAGRLGGWLEEHPEAPLADVAHTLRTGRRPLAHRRAVVAGGPQEAVRALAGGAGSSGAVETSRPPVAFLFPGQGAQHVGMGRGLYDGEPLFRRELGACAEILEPHLGRDLRQLLYPADGDRERAEAELRETRWAQPALFAVEHSLARLWESWGVEPWAMLGHSIGEYVAACRAGVFTLEAALGLVAARGELMQELPPGAMLSVEAPEDAVRGMLRPDLAIATVNGPGRTVVAGPEGSVAALEERCAADGVGARRLHTSHAFHSPMVEPILPRFAERVAKAGPAPPRVPFVSNLTGDWIGAEQATDPGYWAEHMRRTVRFGDGLGRLLEEPGVVLLEVGPGRTLSGLARRAAGGPAGGSVRTIASMRHPRKREDDGATLLAALGELWVAGVEPDWERFAAGEERRRLSLPTYPFEERSFWVEPGPAGAGGLGGAIRSAGAAGVRGAGVASGAGVAEGAPADAGAPPGAEPGGAADERPDLPQEYEAPRTPLERRVVALVEELLGISGVGVRDSFFDLGGDSLLGTRLVARLREELGVELPLQQLFEDPTVGALAAAAEESGGGVEEAPEEEAAAEPAGEAATLARLVERLDSMSDEEARSLLAEMERGE